MARIFWVACPACRGRFVVNWQLRHAGFALICPYCERTFLPDEAAELDERP